ncbi:GDP-mannose mannosyl hydrolase [Sulfurovum sp. XTW-4]|uniref:GDP-mannose mannosyl hydrolase n=1 Tax=Sulfurovum xiamenensis TaxID=3019066 RepID=A0ABT7QNT5_9BACT|nr:GDP-mannose mannosyl hydrolase [Sulfurovum xiamenensis]MDM5262640.1 GDP-mannose mannosyl hydrolase [Sulfurovum xiamenensis]
MKENNPGYLKGDLFKTIIENTPLVSVDIIVKHNGKVLLGKRVNKPAQGYWFTLGGRVLKNEPIKSAIHRICNMEIGMILPENPRFIGVFEHLYNDGIFDDVSTHYVNLAYEIEVSGLEDLPEDQHNEYRWFGLEELIQSDEVHKYVKDYFIVSKGTVPQQKES